MKINSKIFKEYDIRGKYPEEIDEPTAYCLGRVFALSQRAKNIALVRDRRKESAAILPALSAGIKSAKCKILDLGIHSTPAMFFAVGNKKLDGGISVTASHNPIGYAGLKMCDKGGGLLGLDTGLKKVADLTEKITAPEKIITAKSTATPLEISAAYWRFANILVDNSKIRNFKIVLDASNGSGARLADYFFVRLHSKIIKMNFKAGDQFPDHGLNPMLAKNRQAAQREVKKQRADLGIIFDGDGDRCIFIDDRAKFVNPYHLNCLLSQIVLEKFGPISIMIDARLTVGISQVITAGGGAPLVSRAGYANIIQAMQKKRVLFGCENSGHYFFNFRLADRQSKNYIFGDAIMPILLILEYLQDNELKLSEAVAKYEKKYPVSGEINIANVDFEKIARQLKQKYAAGRTEEIDGLSVYHRDWFFNIRPSKTEPLVRLNIEGKNISQLKKEILKIIN